MSYQRPAESVTVKTAGAVNVTGMAESCPRDADREHAAVEAYLSKSLLGLLSIRGCGGMLTSWSRENSGTEKRTTPRHAASAAPALRPDAIDLFTQKMRALHERDQALEEVARLRDAGKIRAAKARLKVAETLHARIEALDQAFAGQPFGRRRSKPDDRR